MFHLVFHECIFYESLLHNMVYVEYVHVYVNVICSMPPPGTKVPSSVRRFSLEMIAFTDSIHHSFIIECKTLAKSSVTCPTGYSFVTLHLFFFFSLSRNRTLIALMLCLLSSSIVHVNSSL